MAKEILIRMVRSSRLCDCPGMSICANIQSSDTIIRTFEELTDYLEELPHMVVASVKVRTAERSKP